LKTNFFFIAFNPHFFVVENSILVSGCSETERISSTGGSFALGTRAPLMAWIPKSFRGSNFAIPALRGDTLMITVRSLSSELTEAELGDTISKITQENVQYAFGTDVDTSQSDVGVTSSGCVKRTPYSVKAHYASTSTGSEPNDMFDGRTFYSTFLFWHQKGY
jgi:hypothetical protein